jgi:hypothetical protein
MPNNKRLFKKLYTTSEVAKILGFDKWRIKNFSEGEAYGLPPAIRAGRGRGSRRLYAWSNICRMLIANQLVSLGFGPEAVGSAVGEIAESKLVGRDYSDPESLFLIQNGSGWDVVEPSLVRGYNKSQSLVVIPFQGIIQDLKNEIQSRNDDEFMQQEFPEVWKETHQGE